MQLVFLALYALVGAALVFLVLLQHGKGSDVGAAFGSGASNAIFGPVGPGTLLSRATAVLAAVFFAMSLGLAWQAKQQLAPVELEDAAAFEALDGSDEEPGLPLPEPEPEETGP